MGYSRFCKLQEIDNLYLAAQMHKRGNIYVLTVLYEHMLVCADHRNTLRDMIWISQKKKFVDN